MISAELFSGEDLGPLDQFTNGKIVKKEEEVKKIDDKTRIIVTNEDGQKRKTIYRNPPSRPVPPQPNQNGRYPQDGQIISWDGLIKEAQDVNSTLKKTGNAGGVPGFPEMPRKYDAGEGKLISWNGEGQQAQYVDPNSSALHKGKAKTKSKGLLGSWNPLMAVRGLFGSSKKKKPRIKYIAPTFPPMPAGDMAMRGMKSKKEKAGSVENPLRKFPTELRKDECNQCFLYQYQDKISPVNVCAQSQDGGDKRPEVIIAIFTQPQNSHARQAIRATWLQHSKGNQASVRYFFVLGDSDDANDQDLVNKESMIYKDILQGGFPESQFSNTYKALCAFNWIQKFCKLALYVVRTDDHTFVNIPSLALFLKQKGGILDYSISGSCSLITKVIRNPTHKWYISYEEFPDGNYPPYCSGPTYIMSSQVANAIVSKSPDIPYFVFDDVYFGLVAKKLKLNLYNQASYFAPGLTMRGCPNGYPWYSIADVQPHDMRKISDSCQLVLQ